jgi:hypothetical protein
MRQIFGKNSQQNFIPNLTLPKEHRGRKGKNAPIQISLQGRFEADNQDGPTALQAIVTCGRAAALLASSYQS